MGFNPHIASVIKLIQMNDILWAFTRPVHQINIDRGVESAFLSAKAPGIEGELL